METETLGTSQECQAHSIKMSILKHSAERVTNTHIYFWGRIFSQWHKLGFYDEELKQRFNCAEQYMMYKKALLFGDEYIAEQIITTADPREQKALGRKIKRFEPSLWDSHRFDIVVDGNMLKFGKHPIAKNILLKTKNMILVEASPHDKIWGVGLHWNDDLILDEKNWKGHNLLGKALMRVRELL